MVMRLTLKRPFLENHFANVIKPMAYGQRR